MLRKFGEHAFYYTYFDRYSGKKVIVEKGSALDQTKEWYLYDQGSKVQMEFQD